MNGKTLDLLLPDWHREVQIAPNMKMVSTGGDNSTKGREIAAKRRDGSEFPLAISVSTWEVEKHKFLTIIGKGVSDSKRLEQNARQNAEKLHFLFNSIREYPHHVGCKW